MKKATSCQKCLYFLFEDLFLFFCFVAVDDEIVGIELWYGFDPADFAEIV